VAKNVTNLTILEKETTGISFNGSTLINGSTVSIPLQTDLDTTFSIYFKFWQRQSGGGQ
jgi:midasin (ATPase involved in ribosome maturation)